MKTTCFRLHYLLTLVIVTIFGTAIHGAEESTKKIEKNQHQEKVAFIDKLSKDYKRLNELWKLAKGRPAGVTLAVMTAMERGFFHAGTGQDIKEIEAVFGQKGVTKVQSDGHQFVFIELEYHDDQIKIPHSEGFQWHLVVGVNAESKVTSLRLEYTSIKWVYMKGFKHLE